MSPFHAALASTLLGLGVGMTMIGRSWPTRGQHRAPRRKPVEEFVPGHHLIPALAHGAVIPQAVAYCRGCHTQVPVTVHGNATRCDQGHVTIHTAGGAL